jgi:AraC family transcriptional regulator
MSECQAPFAPVTQGMCLLTVAAGDLRVTETTIPAGSHFPWHAHEHACLVVLLKGSFTEMFRARSIVCEGPVALFKPAGELHADRYGRQGAQYLIVEFPQATVDYWAQRGSKRHDIASVRGDTVRELALRIQDELTHRDAYSSLVLEGLILQLVCLTFRDRGLTERSQAPAWLRRTRDRLREAFASRLTVAALAAEAGVHPDYLGRSFRRHYGMLIGDYVRHTRVHWAARAIATTEMSLAEVSTAAGFTDQSELTRCFREVMGTTPRRYRNAVRSGRLRAHG